MVAGEVGKDGDVKVQAGNSFLVESMRGNLHDRLGRAAVHTFAKQLQQVTRLWCGVGGRKDSTGGVVFNGAGEDSFAPAMTQHRFEQKCRRRLPVGSSDAAEFELRFRMGEEIGGDGCECAPAMCHFDHRDIGMRDCSSEPGGRISDDGARTLSDCLRNIVIAVRRATTKGDKERAFAHSPRVILDAHHGRVGPDAP